MKQRFVLSGCVLLVLLYTQCTLYPITGSGVPVSKTYQLSEFSSLCFGHGCDVRIEQADSFVVEVSIDDNLESYLDVVQEGKKLRIDLSPGRWYRTDNFKATVKTPFLQEVSGSGGSKIASEGVLVTNNPLEINLSGGSRFSAQCISGNVEVKLSGGSRIELNGLGSKFSLNASGGSIAKLYQFAINEIFVSMSGGSVAEVTTSGVISGNVSGGSTIRYRGDAQVGTVSVSGGSRVKRE